MNFSELLEKAKSFEVSPQKIEETETLRKAFIEKFPLDKIKDLSIDQYVLGTDDNSFCYWLEFKKVLFGIGGGNSSKFGIYKAKDGNYYEGYFTNKKLLTGNDLTDRFNLIIDGICQALEYTKNDEIDKIQSIDIPLWGMVIQKIISIYYPEKFITIGAPFVLFACARGIELEGIELDKNNSILINYMCKKKIDLYPEFQGWHYEKIGYFMWSTFFHDAQRDYYIIGSKYEEDGTVDKFPEMLEKSVIATGFASQLDLSKYYLKGKTEITEYLKSQGEIQNSYNALKHFLNLREGDQIAIKADGSPKGSKGFLSIVGIAEVVKKDGQIYHHDAEGLGHMLNVKYLQAPIYHEFDYGGYGRTIQKLNKIDHIESIFKNEYETVALKKNKSVPQDVKIIHSFLKESYSHRKIEKLILGKETLDNGGGYIAMNVLHDYDIKGDKKGILQRVPFQQELNYSSGKYQDALILLRKYYPELLENTNNSNMDYSKNTILYGPPGTGKTFSTVNKALELLDNNFLRQNYQDRDKLLKKFNELRFNVNNEDGQIDFITFHQSMGYEDFVEGIKPQSPKKQEGSITYTVEDGVLKRMAKYALKDLIGKEYFIFSDEEIKTFDMVYEDYIQSLQDAIGEFLFSTISGHNIKLERISGNSIFVKYEWSNAATKESSGTQEFLISKNKIQELFEADLDPYSIKTLKESFSPFFNHNLSVYYAVYKNFYDFAKQNNVKPKEVLSDSDWSIDELIEKWNSIPEHIQAERKRKAKNYIIIIDEINRGNVSQIFGELITLIEEDKRLGGKEAIEVTLPYSKTSFGVPCNLYIIGTMNTADRSIEALDTALRRRFSFIEMTSNPNLLKTEGKIGKENKGMINGIDVVAMLEKINERIEKLIDKDHKIGHAYFMNDTSESDLKKTFKSKVLPLLEEYFFGDFGKIGLILGSSFIQADESINFEFADFKEYDNNLQSDLKSKKVYKIKPDTEWKFENIYSASLTKTYNE